jgi:hypothetical protein
MNQPTPDPWQELAQMWKTSDTPVAVADIEALHARQHRKLRVARTAELLCSALGVVAALWLALATRVHWVGIVTVIFSIASVYFVSRTRRRAVPQGTSDLLKSMQDSLAYLDWLAEQLRYGRILGFVALFAVVMSASMQLMSMASSTPSGMLATAAAGVVISAALAWNMTVAWQAWRRAVRLQAFKAKLVIQRDD